MKDGRRVEQNDYRAEEPDERPDLRRYGIRDDVEREPHAVRKRKDEETGDLEILPKVNHGPAVKVEDKRYVDVRSVPAEKVLCGV